MKNRKTGIVSLAATLGIGMALFAATGLTSARADGDDWRYHGGYDHSYDHIRFERERDHERLERIRIEEARERRIEQERREHERWEREHRDRDRFHIDLRFGNETHGEHGWR